MTEFQEQGIVFPCDALPAQTAIALVTPGGAGGVDDTIYDSRPDPARIK